MEGLFLQILDMSLSANWLILAVIGIRFLMQKGNVPKNLRYLLWLFVAIRLLCPFTMESAMSLLPRQEMLPEELLVSKEEQVDKLIDVKVEEEIVHEHINGIENIILNSNDADVDVNKNVDVNNIDTNSEYEINWVSIISLIWSIGTIGFLGYGIVSYGQLNKKVSASVCIEQHVWICDEIQTPFLLGLCKPRIYIPSDIEESRIPYIIAHEKEHIRCLDYLWKPLGFFILSMHWFNPLVWTAYILMCKDIEYACDERVIRDMDNAQKKLYTECLLLCSSPRHYISACPVAFGETSIKERIKNVVNYKKPAMWIVGIGVVACILVAVCFMTSPPKEEKNPDTVMNHEGDLNSDGTSMEGNISGDDVEDDTTYIQSVKNKVLFETTADLNHDGIDDLVQTVLIYYSNSIAGDNVSHPDNAVVIKVYRGLEDGTYDKNEVMTTNVSMMSNPVSRDTYVLAERDGKDYLIYTNKYQSPGEITCSYEVRYLRGREWITQAEDALLLSWNPYQYAWEPIQEGALDVFEEGFSSWIEDGIVLITYEAMNTAYYSVEEELIEAASFYDSCWPVSDELLTEDGALLDEKWEQYMYVWGDHNVTGIYWLQEVLGSDFEQWYIGYDGGKILRIEGNDRDQAAHGPSTNLDTIYYKADDNEGLQSIIFKMIEAMLVARMEPEEGRPYTITDYEIGECEIVQISDHIWLVPYLNGYYKFDGTDLVSYEYLVEDYGEYAINGCVPFMSQGSDSQFWYLLIEKDGVYRLQNFSRMMFECE